MHEDEIFTAEDYKAQAAELRAAVAELRRRDEQTIDPQNPFENETEFHDYSQPYTDIVPQIVIPGCYIPMRPNARETGRIRRYCSIVGCVLLAHMFLSTALAMLFQLLYSSLQTVMDKSGGNILPDNYDILLDDYFWASSSSVAMNILVFMLCNAGLAIFGCKWSKIPIPTLFRTKGLTPSRILIYICAAIALQSLCGYLAEFVMNFLEMAGITAYDPQLITEADTKTMVLTCIYSCIVAPITEELLFRGFVLKNLSRVSQRFGIIMSAVLFGLWHENIAQFVLAFFVGIFMGYLTVKHDSLVPAILCHAAVNTAAEFFEVADVYGLDILTSILSYGYFALTCVGVVLLIRMFIRERLPYTTPHQSERGLRIAITSCPLVLVMLGHLFMMIAYIMMETNNAI